VVQRDGALVSLWLSPFAHPALVLTRDPAGKREPKALMSTDPSLPALSIIRTFMKRWSLENTFEEARAHLGIETQRQWSDRAIERSTPLLLSTYSLVALIGHQLTCLEPIRIELAAWYRKTSATFHDVLAAVRRLIWNQQVNPISGPDPDVGLLPRSVLDRLLSAACL
jgi:hypothetical protein